MNIPRLMLGVHILLMSLLGVYAAENIFRWLTKIAQPLSDSVRFWRPGEEMVPVALSLPLLLGIIACSTGVFKHPSRRMLFTLHGSWFVCLTWFGWFGPSAPFRLHELVGVDLTDTTALDRALTSKRAEAFMVYLLVVAISLIPFFFARKVPEGRQVRKR